MEEDHCGAILAARQKEDMDGKNANKTIAKKRSKNVQNMGRSHV